jgi:hypothetical protein
MPRENGERAEAIEQQNPAFAALMEMHARAADAVRGLFGTAEDQPRTPRGLARDGVKRLRSSQHQTAETPEERAAILERHIADLNGARELFDQAGEAVKPAEWMELAEAFRRAVKSVGRTAALTPQGRWLILTLAGKAEELFTNLGNRARLEKLALDVNDMDVIGWKYQGDAQAIFDRSREVGREKPRQAEEAEGAERVEKKQVA